MKGAVETMAYSGKPPWAGLGKKVSNNLTPEQMLKAAGLDWSVLRRPLTYSRADGDPSNIRVPGRSALVRSDNGHLLTIVGSTYKEVQNKEAMEFFKKFVVAGQMKMETAGALHHGQYIWALARLGIDFKLGKDDEIRGYILLCQPHVFGKALTIQFTTIRPSCWNTVIYSLGASLRGSVGHFRMPHSIMFGDNVKKRAEEALGLAKDQMGEFKLAAQLLSKKKAKPDEVKQFFLDVLKFDPTKAKKRSKGDDVIEPRIVLQFKEALEKAPGAQLSTCKGTWWGAVNAVTYIVDHELGRDESAALRTAWLGQKAIMKRRAMRFALDRAT